jgi:hypothetical protein
MRSSLAAAGIALAALAAPVALASTQSDAVIVEVEVFFCNADLFCDPEETHVSCPSDCEAPPEPESDEDEEDRRRRSSRPEPKVIWSPGEGSVSSEGPSEEERQFVESVDVRVTPNGTVEFSWGIAEGESVRILRSENGEFPRSHLEGGVVVYEGNSDSFVDEDVEPGRTYRYAVFHGAGGVYGVKNLVLAQSSTAFEGGLLSQVGTPGGLLATAAVLGLLGGISARLIRVRKK